MLPCAALMMIFWWYNHAWLKSLHQQRLNDTSFSHHWMLLFGILAGLGLILYICVLGESGAAWATQRRVGTVLFFSFTYIAQLLLVRQLYELRNLLPRLPSCVLHIMLSVSITLLILGLMTVGLAAWDKSWYKTVEDAFEWNMTLLLQGNFLLVYFVWRRAGWGLRVEIQ